MTRGDLIRKYRSWLDSDHRVRKLATWFLYQTRRRRLWASVFALDRQARFAMIYRNNLWNNEESVSGAGSTMRSTLGLRTELPPLLLKYQIKSVVDAGCGDFKWMSTVNIDVDYVGIDIVPELVAENNKKYGTSKRLFHVADLTRDTIPQADLVLCRDCLLHCSLEDAERVLRNICRSGATYLLLTHCPEEPLNVDIQTGWARPLNLEIEPFHFPPPAYAIAERWGRVTGLWRTDALPGRYRNETEN